jgi:putative ABC transport system substrate-binding protein
MRRANLLWRTTAILMLSYAPGLVAIMRRREFIILLGAGAAAWPVAARAQQTMPVIGWLGSETRQDEDIRIVPFRQALKELGYTEGQNLAIEYRWAEGRYDRLPALAADLVRRQVAVIVAAGTAASLVAKEATTMIPIVFQMAGDPVQHGLVASLARPGGNMTGVTSLNVEVAPKQLELLHELAPRTAVVALLVNPTHSALAEATTREAQLAADKLGLGLHVLHASAESELDAAFAKSVQLRAGAVVIGPDVFFYSRSARLGALAARHAIPAISPYREFTAAGALVSYGTNVTNQYRQVAVYAGRILKGEKPADLPVEQAVKLELVINLKTAKALGIEVPTALLARADEVIE